MRSLILAAVLAAPLAHAEGLSLYLEGAIGLGKVHDGSGALGHRTYGKMAAGIEWDELYLELEHVSDVQREDEHGGRNVLWFGVRKEWQL